MESLKCFSSQVFCCCLDKPLIYSPICLLCMSTDPLVSFSLQTLLFQFCTSCWGLFCHNPDELKRERLELQWKLATQVTPSFFLPLVTNTDLHFLQALSRMGVAHIIQGSHHFSDMPFQASTSRCYYNSTSGSLDSSSRQETGRVEGGRFTSAYNSVRASLIPFTMYLLSSLTSSLMGSEA